MKLFAPYLLITLFSYQVSARNSNINDIGKVCVDSYRRGQDEARSGAPYTIDNNQFINACKLAGYYDGGEL